MTVFGNLYAAVALVYRVAPLRRGMAANQTKADRDGWQASGSIWQSFLL